MGSVNEKKHFQCDNPYSKGARCRRAKSTSFHENLSNFNIKVNSDTLKDASQLPNSLNKLDLDFICNYTKTSEDQIIDIFQRYTAKNPDGMMNIDDFELIYAQLRSEPKEQLHKISEFVFKAFDLDSSGYLSVNEFIVSEKFCEKIKVSYRKQS